jgi:hypothetical protein
MDDFLDRTQTCFSQQDAERGWNQEVRLGVTE